MIPIIESEINLVDIEKEKYSDYLKNEVIYLSNQNVINEIISKTENIFEVLENKRGHDYDFFKTICCDFNKLEKVYLDYNKKT